MRPRTLSLSPEQRAELEQARDHALNGEIVRALRVYGEPREPAEQER